MAKSQIPSDLVVPLRKNWYPLGFSGTPAEKVVSPLKTSNPSEKVVNLWLGKLSEISNGKTKSRVVFCKVFVWWWEGGSYHYVYPAKSDKINLYTEEEEINFAHSHHPVPKCRNYVKMSLIKGKLFPIIIWSKYFLAHI